VCVCVCGVCVCVVCVCVCVCVYEHAQELNNAQHPERAIMTYSISIGVTPPKLEHIGFIVVLGSAAHAVRANPGCKSYAPQGVFAMGSNTLQMFRRSDRLRHSDSVQDDDSDKGSRVSQRTYKIACTTMS
jgi:hypothetical protein